MHWRWTCCHWVGVSAIEFESASLGSSCRRCVQVTTIVFKLPPLRSSHCRCVRVAAVAFEYRIAAVVFRSGRCRGDLPSPSSRSLHPRLTCAQILSSSSPRTRPRLDLLILISVTPPSSQFPHPPPQRTRLLILQVATFLLAGMFEDEYQTLALHGWNSRARVFSAHAWAWWA